MAEWQHAPLPQVTRTFRAGQRLLDMMSSAEPAKNRIEVGKRHILDQQFRITRQRELITKLERNGHPDALADARRRLAEMEQVLEGMEAHYAQHKSGWRR